MKNWMGGECGTCGGEEHTWFLVERPQGKRQLGRLRRKWEDSIKSDAKEAV